MKRLAAVACVILLIMSTAQALAASSDGSFTGRISLAMNMDTDTLWRSSSSAAFGAVTVMMDITSEKIPEIEFGDIRAVYLAKMKIKNEGTILAYYYFSNDSLVCAIFNPATGKITPAQMKCDDTPKMTMLTFHEEGVIEDFLIIDIDDIKEILMDLMG